MSCWSLRPSRFRRASPANARNRPRWTVRGQSAFGALANSRRDSCRRAGHRAWLRAVARRDCAVVVHDRDERCRRWKHRRQRRCAFACGHAAQCAGRRCGAQHRRAGACGPVDPRRRSRERGRERPRRDRAGEHRRHELRSRAAARDGRGAAARRRIEACRMRRCRHPRNARSPTPARCWSARRTSKRSSARSGCSKARSAPRRSQRRAARLRPRTAHAGGARARSCARRANAACWRAMRCAAPSWPIRVRPRVAADVAHHLFWGEWNAAQAAQWYALARREAPQDAEILRDLRLVCAGRRPHRRRDGGDECRAGDRAA